MCHALHAGLGSYIVLSAGEILARQIPCGHLTYAGPVLSRSGSTGQELYNSTAGIAFGGF